MPRILPWFHVHHAMLYCTQRKPNQLIEATLMSYSAANASSDSVQNTEWLVKNQNLVSSMNSRFGFKPLSKYWRVILALAHTVEQESSKTQDVIILCAQAVMKISVGNVGLMNF